MSEVTKQEMLFSRVTKEKSLINQATGIRLNEQPLTLDYTLDEMMTQVEFDLPV